MGNATILEAIISRGILAASISKSGNLVFTMSDGEKIDVGCVVGEDGAEGKKGDTGVGIETIVRTDGTGAAGTTDTYTITFTDGTTSTFTVYNGVDGDNSTIVLTVPVISQNASDYSEADKAAVRTAINAVVTAEKPNVILKTNTSLIPASYYKQGTMHYFVGLCPDSLPGDDGELWTTFIKYDASNGSLEVDQHANIGDDGEWIKDYSDLESDFRIPTNNLIARVLSIFHEKLSGQSVVSMKQTSTSSADGGANVFTFTLGNGTTSSFTVKNGTKGSAGVKGDKGDKGDKGPAGADGSNGVSPTVTIEKINGGHRVEITDANGLQSFDVLDGSEGTGSGSDSSDTVKYIEQELTKEQKAQARENIDAVSEAEATAALQNFAKSLTPNLLPEVSNTDNNKVLQVVNGIWTAVTIDIAEDGEF